MMPSQESQLTSSSGEELQKQKKLEDTMAQVLAKYKKGTPAGNLVQKEK